MAVVDSLGLPSGTTTSLDAVLQNALAAASAGDITTACNLLGAFINKVQAQSGKKISVEQANRLIVLANEARASLSCS